MGINRDHLIGKRFGRLTVLGLDHIDERGNSWLLCKCDCGNEKAIRRYSLVAGGTSSCGCQHYKIEDLRGQRFGRLTVLEIAGKTKGRKTLWLCRCECGNEIVVVSDGLKSGHTKSCGCLHSDTMRDMKTIHGHHDERLHKIWSGIRNRCYNPKEAGYKNYGGRGIFMCDEWANDYQDFHDWSIAHGYSDDLSIDRIDNDDGYYPSNCRWATIVEQANNRRSNRYITYNNMTHTIAEWARIFNVRSDTLRCRINRGDMRDFEKYFSNKEHKT